ncbi:MAG: alpha/beta fold hydrolase [Firmicutes bacterium]|nr:alpha/beta fold hydrolase [Bacillota bacterium]
MTPAGTACPAKNRRALRISLWVLAALILVVLGAAFWYTNALVSQMVWVHIPPSKATPADLGLAAEDVYFRTTDGLRISAWFVPAKPAAAQAGRVRGTVILVHGWGGDLGTKGDLLGHAQFLSENGYNALPLDLRAHGESDGKKISFGLDEARDVLAAIQYLRARPDTAGGNIALMGFSMGASTVIMAAAQSKDVACVIANSGYAGQVAGTQHGEYVRRILNFLRQHMTA